MKKLASLFQAIFLILCYALLVHHSMNFITNKLSQTVDSVGLIQTIMINLMVCGLVFVSGIILYSIIYKMIKR